MSTLKIREYTKLADAYPGGTAPIAQESGAVVDQTPVSFTSSSVQSAAFAGTTKYIGIKSDVAFCYSVGKNPTATVNMIDQAASSILYVGVAGGDKIAVITAT